SARPRLRELRSVPLLRAPRRRVHGRGRGARGGPVVTMPRPKVIGPQDPVLTSVVIAIVTFGVVMVFSASAVYANRMFEDGAHYLIRQGIFAAVGLTMMMGIARVDYHRLRPLTY